ncbi:MAG: succinyl-diaminopimelate desuccinylase [Propionibacteriaceae bacterium]|jgi:succinyl-diaminopimelate desuccinylase|nr:succinyl-diaminopimelate desuccinylase [Propionibacteriaceae bacterium]
MTVNATGLLDDLVTALVDIESVSGHEAALAHEVEAALRRCEHLSVIRDGDALIAHTELGRPQRVLIAGHLDTVPVAGNLPSRRENRGGIDVLVGRGTVDMKGGVAVQLALAAALDDPRHDLTWVFYDHEEVSADENGLGRLELHHLALLEADLAILMEPTAGTVEAGCQGSLRAVVTTHGRAAHSARSWHGVNAIHAMAGLLTRLRDHASATVVVDGLEYREGLNAVLIEGGVATNVIPDRCSLTINYRFAPDKTLDEAEGKLRAMIAETGTDGVVAEVVLTDRSPAAPPRLGDPLAQDLVAALAVPVGPKLGWTDVARFAAWGIPALNYGPGDPNLAHADDEAVPLTQIHDCYDRLAHWL